jgi:hypothetical protein
LGTIRRLLLGCQSCSFPKRKKQSVSSPQQITCFLPNSFLQDATTLDFHIYVETYDAHFYLLSYPSNRTIFEKLLSNFDDRSYLSVTSDFFGGTGIMIVVANPGGFFDTLMGTNVQAYYNEPWEKWQIWVPIVIVAVVIFCFIFNIILCVIRLRMRKKQQIQTIMTNEDLADNEFQSI